MKTELLNALNMQPDAHSSDALEAINEAHGVIVLCVVMLTAPIGVMVTAGEATFILTYTSQLCRRWQSPTRSFILAMSISGTPIHCGIVLGLHAGYLSKAGAVVPTRAITARGTRTAAIGQSGRTATGIGRFAGSSRAGNAYGAGFWGAGAPKVIGYRKRKGGIGI